MDSQRLRAPFFVPELPGGFMRRLTSAEQDLLDAIERQLASRRSSVITPEISAQAAHLVRSMTDPRPKLHELIGPVVTTADVVDWLGISRQGINKAVRENRILAVQAPSTTWYYPTWQLQDDHSVVSDLQAVLGRLDGRCDQLVTARWFQVPNDDLDGVTPAEWLTSRSELHAVVGAAEAFASARARNPGERPLYDPEIITGWR